MKILSATFYLLFMILFSEVSLAQTNSPETENKLGIGFNVSQLQNDFGLGIHLVSPYIIHSSVAFKLGANLQWFQHFNGEKTTWTPYANVQFGVRGRQFVVEDKISIYGEGGVMMLFPDSEFSSAENVPGGYGVFGFEFYPAPVICYFIEMGGVGTGARADRIDTQPIFSNGFITNVGFRFNL